MWYMSKFAKQYAVPATPVADTRTALGGEGFSRSAKEELFFLGIANAVGENTFHEAADVRDKRFSDLIHEVTKEDPAWVRSFGKWLRSSGLMRSASVVVACEYVAAGGEKGRELVRDVIQRADEPAEVLSYWMGVHGRKIPAAVKRGVADATLMQYNERNTLRYDGQGQAMRFGDVIELTHPKPRDVTQSALFRHLIDRRHNRDGEIDTLLTTMINDANLQRLPEAERRDALGRAIAAGWSWERLAGWLPGGMDAQAWESVIPNMGAMALVRNLRNFDQADISKDARRVVEDKLTDQEEIRRSRQFPIRFLSAWKNVASLHWGSALETAVDLSTANIPHFKGRTLVLIDVSGSMMGPLLSNSRGRGESPIRWEAAALFGLAIAKRSDAADVFTFATQEKPVQFHKNDSVLRGVEVVRRQIGGGTDVRGAMLRQYKPGVHDRVLVLTDEQTGWGHSHQDVVDAIRVPVTTFNLAGYRAASQPQHKNFVTLGGLSDAMFQVLPYLHRGHGDAWPWNVTD
jgi:hypothetical protein